VIAKMRSRFIILCVMACLMAQLGAANVVLMGNNLTLSFDDIEASFGFKNAISIGLQLQG